MRVADGLLVASAALQVQRSAYFFTDLMLLFGLCGIYLTRNHRSGLAGLLGFMLSFLGILMVRSSALNLFGFSAYLVGASVTLFDVVSIGVHPCGSEVQLFQNPMFLWPRGVTPSEKQIPRNC